MQWGQQRQWMVISVLVAAVLAFLLILGFSVFYKTPTCTDNKMNGEETGIDCGGSCSTVCSAEAQDARVRFARVLTQSGRADLIAYIDNPNRDAYAKDARFTISIYREDGRIVEKHAVLSIPTNSSTPLYIPGIAAAEVKQIFVSFDEGQPIWTKGAGFAALMPKASGVSVQGADTSPRVTATLTNPTAYIQNNVPLIATVFAEDGSIVAVSQTVIPQIPAQGSAQAVFTWNEPFRAPYSRIEIIPLLALPKLVP